MEAVTKVACMITGIDISEWNKGIDFAQVKTNADFVIARMTAGVGKKDDLAAHNRGELVRLDIPHGLYHYAYPQYNKPEAEAAYFLSQIGQVLPGEILVLDFEEPFSDPVGWSHTWLDYVWKKTGVRPMIYMNLSLERAHDWSRLSSDYALWRAHWDYDPNATVAPTKWPFVAMRQYTSDGTLKGVPGRVDMNVFYGDIATFKRYGQATGASVPVPVTVVPPTYIPEPTHSQDTPPLPPLSEPQSAPTSPSEPVTLPTEESSTPQTPPNTHSPSTSIPVTVIKPNPIIPPTRSFTDNTFGKTVQAIAYIAVSALLSGLITMATDKPELWGPLTPAINILLVALKNGIDPKVPNTPSS